MGWREWLRFERGYRLYYQSKSPPAVTDEKRLTRLFELGYELRERQLLSPWLRMRPLDLAAQQLSKAMAKKVWLSHEAAENLHARLAHGYRMLEGAECIAAGQEDPVEVLETWLKIEAARTVLLGNFRHVGMALARDIHGQPYWCLDLANPRPSNLTLHLSGHHADTRQQRS